jgi:hypothetical protein
MHARLTVRKPWATYTRTDPTHVARRLNLQRCSVAGEFVHSVAVEHASKHEVVCGSEPAGEKHGEGKTTAEQQLPRASGCEAMMSLRG